jgi:2,4-dienoyl-CoA reductase-like NADH-dependent reductase (Old Yellow Enzyme family)
MNMLDAFIRECKISKKTAHNRFLAQPCEHNHANMDGGFSEPLFDFYRRIKAGNWGLVVMETTAISPWEKCRKNQLVLADNKTNEESWKKFFYEMKKKPSNRGERSLWIVQITAAVHQNISGPQKALFNGQLEFPQGPVLSTEEVDTLLDTYVNATRLTYERGADGIDFKQCHGYFAGLFLRPNNQREDHYGRSFDNRTRFLREYVTRSKKEIGDKEFLWTTRINSWDGGYPGSFGMAEPKVPKSKGINAQAWIRDVAEVEKFYGLLDTLGFDLVNVSAGSMERVISIPAVRTVPPESLHPNFYILQDLALHAKNYFRERKSGMVIASKGWSALGLNALTIGPGYIDLGIDFLGFGRWQLSEPFLPKIVEEATVSDPIGYIKDNANICLACSRCSKGLRDGGREGVPVKCAVYQ